MAIPKYHWNIVQFAGTELGLSDEGPHFGGHISVRANYWWAVVL